MPYFAPEAAMPMTSCAPRFAEIKASPQIQAGSERPARKKSELVFTYRFRETPIPKTKAKYNNIISQSIGARVTGSPFLEELAMGIEVRNTVIAYISNSNPVGR